MAKIKKFPKNFFINKIFLIFILILNFQSWTNADDIKDFEIEGISIGDSLLDFFTKVSIDKKKSYKQNYNDDEFVLLRFNSPNQKDFIYPMIRFHIKKNDEDYLIYHIGGNKNLSYSLCKKEKKIITEDLTKLFSKDLRQDYPEKSHAYDKTGNSKTISSYFDLDNGRIRIMCTFWSKKLKSEKRWKDSLTVNIYSEEFINWLQNKAYK
jgi:hypothetical protein